MKRREIATQSRNETEAQKSEVNLGKTRRGKRSAACVEDRRARRKSHRRTRRNAARIHRGEVGQPLRETILPVGEKLHITTKQMCGKLQKGTKEIIFHNNIEGIRVPGRLKEVCHAMEQCGARIGILTECKITGSITFFFRTEHHMYKVLQSGMECDHAAGVVFIIRSDMWAYCLSFTPVSGRCALLLVKVIGGIMAIIGAYLRYQKGIESAQEESARIESWQELDELVESVRPSPVVVVGDFNTSIKYRTIQEKQIFGPYMFTHNGSVPIVESEREREILQPELPNRDLLADLCINNGLLVKNTFIKKSLEKKITFFRKGVVRPPPNQFIVDVSKYKEIDHVLISQQYASMVTDIKYLRKEQIGRTTHIPCAVSIQIPIRYRQRKDTQQQHFLWNKQYDGFTTAATIAATQQVMQSSGLDAYIHNFEPQELRGMTKYRYEDGDEEVPVLRYYIDGSGPDRSGPKPAQFAGWAFVLTISGPRPERAGPEAPTPIPLYRNGQIEWIVACRWGQVETDPSSIRFLGANHHSNNTAELTAICECLLFHLFELPQAWRDCPLEVKGDSLIALSQTTGQWDISQDSVLRQLAENCNMVWQSLGADVLDSSLCPGWVKGHSGDPGNDIADTNAKKGRFGFSPQRRQYSLDSVRPALNHLTDAFESHVLFSGPCSDISATKLYQILKEINIKTHEILEQTLPKTKPHKPYHDPIFLALYDERRTLIQNGANADKINEITKKLEKHASKTKKERIFKALETEKESEEWDAVRQQKEFRAPNTRLRGPDGKAVASGDRAKVFADFYEKEQWGIDPQARTTGRPPIFPVADVSTGEFKPKELRKARKKLKRKKASGEDKICNEFLVQMLNQEFGFGLIWTLVNKIWKNKELPGELHIATIIAIFKASSEDTGPAAFRPISLLNTVYKFFTILLVQRLSCSAITSRISINQFGYKKGQSVDSAIFRLLRSIENFDNYNNHELYLILLDWQKCFDRVHPGPLLEACARFGLPPEFLQMLEHIYSNKLFLVKDHFGKSGIRRQRTGLAQGDSLSCILLNILTTVIMFDAQNEWKKSEKYDPQFNDLFKFEYVLYADDTNLASTNLVSIRVMLHTIETEARNYGLQLNLKKTTLLRIGTAALKPLPKFKSLNGTKINIKDIDYTLGFPLGAKGTNKKMVSNKISSLMYSMKKFKLIWQSKMKKKRKIQKYFSLVLSKATWGIHLLALGKTEFKKLEYYHVRCLRRILGIKASYISRVSNDTVLYDAGVPSIKTHIRMKQYKLLGHILRLPQGHPDRDVCFQPGTECEPRLPQGFTRRRGRPRLRWAEVLIHDFMEKFKFAQKGKTRKDVYELAQDRVVWRHWAVVASG